MPTPHVDSSDSKLSRNPLQMLRGSIARLLPRTLRGTLLLLLLVAFIPRELAELSHYFNLFQERRSHEYQANLELARSVGATFDAYVRDILRQELLTGLAITSSQPPSPEYVQRLLAAGAHEYPSIRDFGWVDSQGRILASIEPRAVGQDISDRSYFTEIAGGRDWVISDLMRGRFTDEVTFFISRGIRDERGVLQGVVVSAMDPQRLGEVLEIERSGEASAGIIDRQGRLVYRYPEIPLSWDGRNVLAAQPFIAPALAGREVVGTFATLPDGRKRMSSYASVDSIGWVVGSGRPEDEAMTPVFQELSRESGQELGIAGIAFVLALFVSRSVTGPIKSLREQAQALGRGETSWPKEISRPIELKELAGAFDEMSHAIRTRTQELELILHAVRTVSSAEDFDAVLSELARLLAQAANVPVCRLALLVNGDRDLVLRARYSEVSSKVPSALGIAFPVDEVPAFRQIIEEKQAIEIKGLHVESFAGSEREHWKFTGLKSCFGMPLLAHDKVIGIILLGDVRPRLFSEDEKRLCMAVAQQTSAAIERADLYQQMFNERERLEAIIQNTSDGVVLLDEQRRVVGLNPAMEILSGWTAAEAKGRACWEVFQSHDRNGTSICDTACPMLRTMEGGNAVPYAEVTITRKDGQPQDLSASYAYIRLPDRGPGYGVAICRDISKLKEVEKLKDEFASLLSHDLRGLLAIIQGHAQLILRIQDKAGLEGTERQSADAIVNTVHRMTAMIRDLVDSTRLESGQMQMAKEPVTLGIFVPELLERATGMVDVERVHTSIQPDLPVVIADKGLLERIVLNLLTNALKYSPTQAKVLVKASMGTDEVIVSVADRGVGISPEDLPRVFERFFRGRGRQEGRGNWARAVHHQDAGRGSWRSPLGRE